VLSCLEEKVAYLRWVEAARLENKATAPSGEATPSWEELIPSVREEDATLGWTRGRVRRGGEGGGGGLLEEERGGGRLFSSK
jgi:hypothetical protein